MGQYFIRRFIYLLGVLLVVSVITFFIMHQVPGGPFSREKQLSPTALANLNAKYHLDDPLYKQYTDYMLDLAIPRVTSGDWKTFQRLKTICSISAYPLETMPICAGSTSARPIINKAALLTI